MDELGELISWIIEKYSLPALNFVMRFGDPDLRSSTMHHLHGHIQIPSFEVLPRYPPKLINWNIYRAISLSNACYAVELKKSFQRQFAIIPSKLLFSLFFHQMSLTLKVIKEQAIQGGGIVLRWGDRRYTNGQCDLSHIKIYAPDGTGRVHATFIPASDGKGKPLCKATFCKGFKGEELEKLQGRMKEFQNL